VTVEAGGNPGRVWIDYSLYTRASYPFELHGLIKEQAIEGVTAWREATGFDSNSRVAPMMYWKSRDSNGRWRGRCVAVSVGNLTRDFNLGEPGPNALPYKGGGTFIAGLPQNWKPWGDPEKRVYVFEHEPVDGAFAGAFAARMWWFAARTDYRTADGRRVIRDLYRAYCPPDQIPPGSFCQDEHTGLIHVRLPSDSADPNPIGEHLKLPPDQAIGYYVIHYQEGPAQQFYSKLIDPATADAMVKAGIEEVEVMANALYCIGGTPMLEKGTPILGLYRDADGMARPVISGAIAGFGCFPGPGSYDVGASECGYWVQ